MASWFKRKREAKLSQLAAEKGLMLRKARMDGTFYFVDAFQNFVVGPPPRHGSPTGGGMSLKEAEEWIKSDADGRLGAD